MCHRELFALLKAPLYKFINMRRGEILHTSFISSHFYCPKGHLVADLYRLYVFLFSYRPAAESESVNVIHVSLNSNLITTIKLLSAVDYKAPCC